MRFTSNKRITFALRAGISILLLIGLLLKTDSTEIAHAFLEISPATWLITFILYLCSQFLSSFRWYLIAHAVGFKGKWNTYLGYYFVGMYFNLFMPSSIGGDVLKVLFLSREYKQKLKAAYTVLADRVFGLAAMFLLGSLAVIIAPDAIPMRLKLILIGTTFLVYISPFALIGLNNLIRKRWPEISQRVDITLQLLKNKQTVVFVLLISLLLQFIGMNILVILAKDMGLSPPPSFYYAIFPLVTLMTFLPISLNGIGIRETGFAYFLSLKDIPMEKALILSLSFFAIQVAAALVGGGAYIWGAHKRSITAPIITHEG